MDLKLSDSYACYIHSVLHIDRNHKLIGHTMSDISAIADQSGHAGGLVEIF